MSNIDRIITLKKQFKDGKIEKLFFLKELTKILESKEFSEKDIYLEDAEFVKNQLQDTFNIYLDTDIAGDNNDRRQKLNAFNTVFSKLKTS